MKSLNLRRVGAYVIDIFIVGMIASLIGMIPIMNPTREAYNDKYDELISVNKKYENKEISEEEYRNQYISISYQMNRYNTSYILIDFVVIIGYFAIFQWQQKGQTIGKRLLKVKVISSNDKKIGFVNYLIRTVILNNVLITIGLLGTVYFMNEANYYTVYTNINLVGYVLLYAIIFCVLIRQDSRGLHDLFANTKVVMVDPKEVPIAEEEHNEESIVKQSKKKKTETIDATFEEVEPKKKSTKSKK